jgi:integrase
MATFRKRGEKWQAQIRRNGHPPISKSFINKRDAESWARDVERRIERGELIQDQGSVQSSVLGDLLHKYQREISTGKKSEKVEGFRIGLIRRHSLARFPAEKITPKLIAAFRDERLQSVSGETVRQDLVLLRQVFDVARREWGIAILQNPVDDVKKPKPAQARTRRLKQQDLEALNNALKRVRNPLFGDIIEFAIATGMRRGEILRMRWSDVNFSDSLLSIPITKNGHPRLIPLSTRAIEILQHLKRTSGSKDHVFQMSPNAVRLAWQRLVRAAGIEDLRFHDFRHEAVSRFFEAGLSLPEVALISGHRDPRQLMRYTHLEASKVAEKLKRQL